MSTSMRPNLGISEHDAQEVARLLNTLLADEYVIYTRTRNYHWNVVGPQFNELHKFFQAQYEQLDGIVDEVAERARTLGGHALGTLAEFVKHTRLKEHPGEYPDARGMIMELLNDHEVTVRHLRVDLETCASTHHDMGTSDFLTGIMEQHEKMAWMLRAFLEGK